MAIDMQHGNATPTRRGWAVATLVALSLTGCGALGGGDGAADFPDDLCAGAPSSHSYLVDVGVLDESALAELPAPVELNDAGYWEVEPLGADGASRLGEDFAGEWVCDLAITPAVLAGLTAMVDGAEPFSVEAARALIDEAAGGLALSLSGAGAPGSLGTGRVHSATKGGILQKIRDILGAAGAARKAGDHDAAEALLEDARNAYREYADDALDGSSDIDEVLEMLAETQLLGMDDLSDRAKQRADELVKEEFDRAAAKLTPCTTDGEVVQEYVRALAQAQLMGVVGPEAQGVLDDWADVQDRRRSGEPVPECEGGRVQASVPLTNWDGDLTLDIETCDFVTWSGTITAAGGLDVDGGDLTLDSEIPVRVTMEQQDPPRQGSAEFSGTLRTVLTSTNGNGEGEATLRGVVLVQETGGRDVEVRVTFEPTTYFLTVTVEGQSYRQQSAVDWRESVFTGTIAQLEGGCDEAF